MLSHIIIHVLICLGSAEATDRLIRVTYGASGCPRIVVRMTNIFDRSIMLENGLMRIDTFSSFRPYRYSVHPNVEYVHEIQDINGNMVTSIEGSPEPMSTPRTGWGYDTVLSVGIGSEFLHNVGSVMLIPPRDQSGYLVASPSSNGSFYCLDGIITFVVIDPLFPRIYATMSWLNEPTPPLDTATLTAIPNEQEAFSLQSNE